MIIMEFLDMPLSSIPRWTLKSMMLIIGITMASHVHALNYNVEILVFERDEISEEIEEKWNPKANSQRFNEEKLNAMAELASNHTISLSIDHLSRLEQELRLSGYRILYTARWQQPSSFFQNAPVISINAPDTLIQGAIRVYKTSLIFVDISLGLADPEFNLEQPHLFSFRKKGGLSSRKFIISIIQNSVH